MSSAVATVYSCQGNAGSSVTERIRPQAIVERSVAPNRLPGSSWSSTYFAMPQSFSGPSLRRTLRPTTFLTAGILACAEPPPCADSRPNPALASVVVAARAQRRVEQGSGGRFGALDELRHVDALELAALDHDPAVHHHGVHGLGPRREHERGERGAARARVREPACVDEHEGGGLARLPAAHVVAAPA